MVGLSHIFLHLGLCSAATRLPPQAMLAMQVQMAFVAGDPPFDQTFAVERGDGPEEAVEFDVARGSYRLTVNIPKYACRATAYVTVLPDQARTITVTLADPSQPAPPPTLLLDGTAPMSFIYLKPTYVLLDANVTCNQPVGQPLPAHVAVDYTQTAYYASMYVDPALASMPPVLAFRLETSSGLAHYVRIPMRLPAVPVSWPSHVQMNVSDDMVDGLATEKTDVLLCPKIWETSVH